MSETDLLFFENFNFYNIVSYPPKRPNFDPVSTRFFSTQNKNHWEIKKSDSSFPCQHKIEDILKVSDGSDNYILSYPVGKSEKGPNWEIASWKVRD